MADDAKTAPGAPTVSGLITHEDRGAGTIQMKPGAAVESAPPVMPTLTGAPVPDVRPPAMPGPRYQIGDEIARGGMGRVVEATDTVLGRVVALKEALALDDDALRRFARETRITARLEHPSIVPVHDAGASADGAPFYVMRKISGRPLERFVATAEHLPDRLALIPHIVATAQAVAHAHERGIVHRDIKPSNILVGDLGETMVIDWGLAKVMGEADDLAPAVSYMPRHTPAIEEDSIKTRAGIVFGTPGFMAPEQLRGQPVNERCDVYALGASLYHLLSRKPPHHAKTADEMMKAAAHAPPTPILELVPGVAPELSTIIDKALAYDPRERYPDARAFAEDLQRFLTGQLVASHHYSPREKLVRFVHKHRVPVMIAGAATVLLLLVGILAFFRVVGERDRADAARQLAIAEKQTAELERARAETQLEKVQLQQARNEVTTNPTRAVAMIRPLAAKHAREVRSIAIAARAAGTAWSLPASKETATLELSRDGQRALGAGTDGVIRVYDLAKRTTRTVYEWGSVASARFADEGRRILAWHDARLVVIDPATNQRTEIAAPSPIRDLEVVGSTAYWIDRARKMWVLELAGTRPLEILLPEPVDQLAPSPDGRWIALFGVDHLMIYDRSQPAAEPQPLIVGVTKDLDWSADGEHLAALIDQQAIEIELVPVPLIIHKETVGNRQFVLRANDRVYTIGPLGVSMVSRDRSRAGVRKPLVGAPVGLVEARGNTVVAGSQGGIAILGATDDHALTVPAGRIDILAASPRSPFVVATIEGRLLVWNLDEIEPQRIEMAVPEQFRFVGTDHALAWFADGPMQWIDLATGAQQPVGEREAIRDVAGAPGGQLACVIDISRRALLVMPGLPPEELPGTATHAGFATDRDLLLADEAGAIDLYDLRTRKRAPLVSRKARFVDMAWSRTEPAWVAAVFEDGTLWRKNLTTGAEASASAAITPTTRLLVTGDGTVLFAEARMLRAWRPDGTVDTHAELAKPIIALGVAGAGPAIVFTAGGATHLVELDARNQVVEAEPVGANRASMAVETGVFVAPNRGGIDVVDPIVRHRWTLASATGTSYRDAQISSDGRRVIAYAKHALLVWNLPRPPTNDATAQWLETMTNAIIDAAGRLSWQ